jgi:hypothetical protein
LPGLKWGTRFSGICTLSPDRGLRPGRPSIDGETAESANFDAMAFDQSFAHGVQHRFDSEFGVTVSQLLKASSQGFNEVGSSHVKNVREA